MGGRIIHNIRYTNDTVLIANSEERLQRLVEALTQESQPKGLNINSKKTEALVISKEDMSPIQ